MTMPYVFNLNDKKHHKRPCPPALLTSCLPFDSSNIKKQGLDVYLNPCFLKFRSWQLVIFPEGGPSSIFTTMSLYDRVRDGNGCFPHVWSPANLLIRSRIQNCIMTISFRNHPFLGKALVLLVSVD